MTEEQKQLDAAWNNKEIGNEIHTAASAMLKESGGKMKALPSFNFDDFLTFLKWAQTNLKWLQDNSSTILNNVQTFITLLNQLFGTKA